MAYIQKEVPKKPAERQTDQYLDSSRSELVNHYKTEAAKEPSHSITDFLTKTIWSWLYHYVKSRFGRTYPYQAYSGGKTGIYALETDRPTSIAIASDWATNTNESVAVAHAMEKHNPDYTIHVGDTYFVGAPPEIYSNFVEDGSPWVRGQLGSFAVLGNHEMYARGDAFFECLLPSLGIRDDEGVYRGQEAGFFCLQNDYWRVLGLDTGYHSIGTPIIEFLPGCSPKCQFDDIQMAWLRDVVRLGDASDQRGLLILTHHQFITAFGKEEEYEKPAQQLASLVGRSQRVLWLWGHEHKLALYGNTPVTDTQLSVVGRCIGHGGTPVQVKAKQFTLDPGKKGHGSLVAIDKRTQQILKGTELGFNGYVLLTIDNDTLRLDYHDTNNRLLTEEWVADTQAGTLRGTITPTSGDYLSLAPEKNWPDAVN